ncbi:hypothetical protein MP228_012611 [Amoeboaphelidium protococcarum]|nr:hypothetical protein MP228_012611 [Amoeboaphelidium protococcarum]
MRPIILHGHTRPLTQIAYNKDGDLLFTAAKDKSPNVYYAHNGEQLGTFDGHNGAVLSLSVSQDSSRLLTSSADQTAIMWRVETGEVLQKWQFNSPVRCAQFDGYSDTMFLILTDSMLQNPSTLNIYEVGQEEALKSIVIEGPRAQSARWGPLRKTIILAHQDGSLSVYDSASGEKVKSLKVHSAPITDMQLYKDKTYLITSSKDETSKIVDLINFKIVKTYASDRPLNSACLSPIYEQVILGGGQEARDVTTTSAKAGRFEICFFHRVFAEEIGRVKGHFGPVNTLAFNPDGKSFASGGEDGYVRINHFDPDYFEYDYDMEA